MQGNKENRFVVNPVLSVFEKTVDGSKSMCMQLNAYDDVYKLSDNSIPVMVRLLQKGKVYTDSDLKLLIDEHVGSEHVGDLYDFLVGERLIIHADDDPLTKYTSNYSNHLEGKVYHEATRTYPFLNMAQKDSFSVDNQRMVGYLETDEYPNPYKDYNECIGHLALPQLDSFEDFRNIYASLEKSSYLARLGMILGFCFGERRERHLTAGLWDYGEYRFELLFKSVPSGGSKHPTECYIISDATHLPKGCYHYSVRHHNLEHITKDVPTWADNQTFIVVTAFIERSMWRYRDPRSWRAIPCEIGHVLKLLAVVSRSMSISVNEMQRGDSEQVRALLQISDEEPIYSILEVVDNV